MVYERDNGICRVCGKTVNPLDFDIGHNRAHSRGGKLTLANALLLHPDCNRSMSTASLKQVRRSIGLTTPEDESRTALKRMSLFALRYLAKKHGIRVKGRVETGWFTDSYISPSKTKFVNALAKVITADKIQTELQEMPARTPKKRRR